jgi:hypothetical protein
MCEMCYISISLDLLLAVSAVRSMYPRYEVTCT